MMGAGVVANAMNSKMQRDDLLDASVRKLEMASKGKLTKESAAMVAKEFETLFVGQMIEHMFEGESMGDSMFGSEESDEIYKGMMVENYSKAIVKGGGIGIAQYIERALNERALLKAQEVA